MAHQMGPTREKDERQNKRVECSGQGVDENAFSILCFLEAPGFISNTLRLKIVSDA